MNKKELKTIAMRYPNEVLLPFADMLKMNGFDAICAFTDFYGGSSIYIPKTRSVFARCIEEEIKNQSQEESIAELSRKFGFTERHVRRLVGKP